MPDRLYNLDAAIAERRDRNARLDIERADGCGPCVETVEKIVQDVQVDILLLSDPRTNLWAAADVPVFHDGTGWRAEDEFDVVIWAGNERTELASCGWVAAKLGKEAERLAGME